MPMRSVRRPGTPPPPTRCGRSWNCWAGAARSRPPRRGVRRPAGRPRPASRRPRSKGRYPSLRRERRQILGDPTLRFRDLPGDLPGSPRAHPDTGSADGPRISGGAATSDGGRVGRRLGPARWSPGLPRRPVLLPRPRTSAHLLPIQSPLRLPCRQPFLSGVLMDMPGHALAAQRPARSTSGREPYFC